MSSPKNRLILGTMTIGPDPAQSARITSMDDYKRCLDYLSARGYAELDTAAVYVGGLQEAWTRDAGFRARGFGVASKIMPVRPGDHAPARLRELWDVSLGKLGVESAEVMYLHAPDHATAFEETLGGADQLYREGKFGQLGLSNFSAWEVAEIVGICERRGFVKPTVYQGMYNPISRGIESELIPCLRKFGISLVIYNPLAAGLFSGKYTTLDDDPAEGRFSTATSLGRVYRDRYFKQSALDALAAVEPAARKHGVPLVEAALRWCVHHSKLRMRSEGGDDGVILGISSYAQLEQNVEACEKGPLPGEVVEALERAWEIARGDAPQYWR